MRGNLGTIRIIESQDGKDWKSLALIGRKKLDLRDPKFSITPDGKLMLSIEGTSMTPVKKKYRYRQAFATFSDNGKKWSPLKPCMEKHEWPWGVTWFDNTAYTASYKKSGIKLFKSADGLYYEPISKWKIKGFPTETTLRFRKNGKMIALVRHWQKNKKEWHCPNWIGVSTPPYKKWHWNKTDCHLGGPNFLILPNKQMVAAGRILYPTPYGVMEKMAIAKMTEKKLKPLILLPSAGDSSYPGMAYEKGVLFVSYYASHEGKASIYFARIKMDL